MSYRDFMPKKTIIYGQIINGRERRSIEKEHPNQSAFLQWLDDPKILKHPGNDALVIVDLDDPKFMQSDFLLSIATIGQDIKIVGKSENPKPEDIIKVAEVLNA
jgi:hypothetical protein